MEISYYEPKVIYKEFKDTQKGIYIPRQSSKDQEKAEPTHVKKSEQDDHLVMESRALLGVAYN